MWRRYLTASLLTLGILAAVLHGDVRTSKKDAALLREKVASTDVQEVLLEDSYHVATLDNDAPAIFEGSLDFVRRLARTP